MTNQTNDQTDLTNINKKVRTKPQQTQLLKDGKAFIKKQDTELGKFTQRNKNTKHINYKTYYLLHDPLIYINAYGKISKNDGALTRAGQEDEGIMEFFGIKEAQKIADLIKNETYTPSPARRVMIPKTGKTTKRPLDTPSQKDRIVQEAVRSILEAVFEPEFLEHDIKTKRFASNYGFRSSLSTWDAVDMIQKKAQTTTVVIEGDIVGTYNNVNQTKLLKLIQKRIPDKKFLKLLDKFLKAGYILDNRTERTLLGTPQGSIISPILFNIYLFELDKWVYNKYIAPNILEGKLERTINPFYKAISSNIERRRKKLKKLQLSPSPTKKEIKKTKLELKILTLRRRRTTKNDPTQNPEKNFYARYADDWVLLLTTSIKRAIQIKQEITNHIKEELDMELDKDKTKLTKTSDRFNFLGFNIGMRSSNKITTILLKKPNNFIRSKIRSQSRRFTIIPDKERILKKMLINGYICQRKNNPHNPIAKRSWAMFTDYEIVLKFSQIMRGITTYYKNCTNTSSLQHISYLLWASCLSTLRHKKKQSSTKIISNYGKELQVPNPNLHSNYPKTVRFEHHYQLIKKINSTKETNPTQQHNTTEKDPFQSSTTGEPNSKCINTASSAAARKI
jgi:group II intron reverse transcriptase/maturase